MHDAESTARQLRAIKELGVGIAIDDFGTGYSSLAYLRQFPVDILKIDRSFVSAISDSAESSALIRTLVQLGKQLGLKTLAEGIEQHEQFCQLQHEECDSGQGFMFARPLAADAVETFLAELPAARVPAPAARTGVRAYDVARSARRPRRSAQIFERTRAAAATAAQARQPVDAGLHETRGDQRDERQQPRRRARSARCCSRGRGRRADST